MAGCLIIRLKSIGPAWCAASPANPRALPLRGVGTCSRCTLTMKTWAMQGVATRPVRLLPRFTTSTPQCDSPVQSDVPATGHVYGRIPANGGAGQDRNLLAEGRSTLPRQAAGSLPASRFSSARRTAAVRDSQSFS